jgi:hypothetical protein
MINIAGIAGFLKSKDFLTPFLSTVGASLTVLLVESMRARRKDSKKKLYVAGYMADVSRRMLHSSLFLQERTILPHIDAVKKILKGDAQLAAKMFAADEFDILTDPSPQYFPLPEDHKVEVGYDDIELLQAFEFVMYQSQNDGIRRRFNDFVREKLKSELQFRNRGSEERADILNTYWDYLDRISYAEKRTVATILYILLPKIESYARQRRLLFYSKKGIKEQIALCDEIKNQFAPLIPGTDFFEKASKAGIQRLFLEDEEQKAPN